MSTSLMAAGGLALACAVLVWLLLRAQRTIGKLKSERAQYEQTIRALAKSSALSKDRIRDLTGLDPDSLRIDEAGGVWAE